MADLPRLSRVLADFLRLLKKYEVRYVVVGSWALSIHAQPRYTKDIDILISRDAKNASQILAAMSEFGFTSSDLSADDFMQDAFIVQLGREPNRIDILTKIDGVDFEQAERNAVLSELEGIPIHFLSLHDLIEAKKATSRPRDLADLEQLEQLRKCRET